MPNTPAGSIFAPAVDYPSVGNGPDSVEVADMNGDGVPDLVVAGGVLLGNGDGTFQSAISYDADIAGFPQPMAGAVGDVNGDGKPDLLLASVCHNDPCYIGAGSGAVLVLLGNGDGTFQPAVAYSSGSFWCYSLAVGDVNGDGKLDVITSNLEGSNRSKVSVLLGNGDGTFQPAIVYDSGGWNPRSLAVADLNGDGKLDFAVTNSCILDNSCPLGGSVGVFLGNGDGTFQPVVDYFVDGEFPSSVAIGDVNGDGKPDLVVGGDVFLGNGDGTFQAGTMGGGGGILADCNGDGKLDLVSGGALSLGNGDGTFQTPTPISLGASGTGAAVGDFNRDGRRDLAVGSVQVLLNVAPNYHHTTTTVVTSSLNPARAGQTVTFSATVTPKFNAGAVTGGISFYNGAIALSTVPISNGKASFSTSSLAPGAPSITAAYSGDSNYLASTSVALGQTIQPNVTTTTVSSSTNPSVFGKPITFTAMVSSSTGTPTGKIQFLNGTTVLATLRLTSGSAKYTTSKLPSGANSITAVYEGDSNNGGSTSATVDQIVLAATTTTLMSSPNPSAYGQPVIFTAAVTSSLGPPPNGETVTFMQGATVLGRGTLNGGTTTFTTSTLGVGTKPIKATYTGNATFANSTSAPMGQIIRKSATTTVLVSSLSPSNYGQPVMFTAAVAPQFGGMPTGTVVFRYGTRVLKNMPVTGDSATFITSKLAKGVHNLTVTYNGSSNFTNSSASLNQNVQ